jgi:hypothetical protein
LPSKGSSTACISTSEACGATCRASSIALRLHGREVHRHQDAPVGFVRQLADHQHRPGRPLGDALGGRSDDHTPKEPGAACAGHDEPRIHLVGMPDDLLHRVPDAQVRCHRDALCPGQFGGQFLQALACIGLDGAGRLAVVGQPAAQIVERRAADRVLQRQRRAARPGQQRGPLRRVPRRCGEVCRCDDGAQGAHRVGLQERFGSVFQTVDRGCALRFRRVTRREPARIRRASSGSSPGDEWPAV